MRAIDEDRYRTKVFINVSVLMKFQKKCAEEEILEKGEVGEVGGMEQNDDLTGGFQKQVESGKKRKRFEK